MDGIFATTFREANKKTSRENQWKSAIVFDGKIDCSWVVEINSLIGEGVLTLASSQRLQLNPHVSFVFEVTHSFLSPTLLALL